MMIKIKNLYKNIDSKEILKDISLEVQKGETVAIIGKSGVGKSTLLNCIMGLEKQTKGEIYLFGQEITCLKEEELNALRKKMGMVFQYAALFDSLTVQENVAFALRQHTKLSEKEINKIVKEKLQLLELSGTEELLPAQLSGGMQRRVGIARALALNPEIVLYDEPTTGLDPLMTKNLNEYILKLKKTLQVTSVVVTHDLDTAFLLADRIGMISEGELITLDTPEKIKKANNSVVKEFIFARENIYV